MKTKYEQVNKEKATLGRENKRLYDENKFLAEVNEAFANENDDLRKKLDQYAKIRLPRSMRFDDRRRKATSKGKKVARLSDDELEDDSDSEADESEKHERDEKGARVFDFK